MNPINSPPIGSPDTSFTPIQAYDDNLQSFLKERDEEFKFELKTIRRNRGKSQNVLFYYIDLKNDSFEYEKENTTRFDNEVAIDIEK